MQKLQKPNNIVSIPTKLGTGFFKWWCIFLRPFIKLTNREIDVMACFLKQRYELSKKVSDPKMLDALVMNKRTIEEIIKECQISQEYFYVVLSNLRKRGIIKNDAINPRLIPNIRQEDGRFQLLILFDFK